MWSSPSANRLRLPKSRVFFLAGLFAASGCTAALIADPAPPPAQPRCAEDDSALVRDVLYFGRNRPAGGVVGDDEWKKFLNEVVTPRFPEGLTVVEGRGQWKGEDGKIVEERSEIMTLLHPGNADSNKNVIDIAEEYKRRFQQEAVLRERSETCAHF